MNASLRVVLKYFKYASIIFIIVFPIYLIFDDWPLTKHISDFSDLVFFVGGHFLLTAMYYLIFSVYFWVLAYATVFAYQKIYKARMN